MAHVPTLVLFALAAGSLAALVVAIRGRKVPTPHACYRCGFDVASIIVGGATHKKCPECGSPLDDPKAARSFRRQRYWKLAAPSFIILVPCLWLLSVRAVAGFQAANWWRYAPTSLLCWGIDHLDGRQLDGAARAAVDRFNSEIAAKRTEIPLRLKAAAMNRHRSSKPWCPVLGTVIQNAYDHDLITPKEAAEFVYRSWTIKLETFRGYFPGQLLWSLNITCTRGEGVSRFDIWPPKRLGSHKLDSMPISARLVSVNFKGQRLPLQVPESVARLFPEITRLDQYLAGHQGTGVRASGMALVDPIDTSGTIEATYEISIGDERWTIVETGTGYSVGAQPQPLVAGGAPDSLAKQMHDAFSATAYISGNLASGEVQLVVTPSADRSKLAMPICFSPELGPNAKPVYDLGTYPYLLEPDPGQRNQPWFNVSFALPNGWNEKTIDVIIQPHFEVRYLQIDEIETLLASGQTLKVWDQPIVLKDVPVEDRRPKPDDKR